MWHQSHNLQDRVAQTSWSIRGWPLQIRMCNLDRKGLRKWSLPALDKAARWHSVEWTRMADFLRTQIRGAIWISSDARVQFHRGDTSPSSYAPQCIDLPSHASSTVDTAVHHRRLDGPSGNESKLAQLSFFSVRHAPLRKQVDHRLSPQCRLPVSSSRSRRCSCVSSPRTQIVEEHVRALLLRSARHSHS